MKAVQATKHNTLRRLGIPNKKLPRGWTQAAGLLKHKRIDGLAYQRQVREESKGYLTTQRRFARGG